MGGNQSKRHIDKLRQVSSVQEFRQLALEGPWLSSTAWINSATHEDWSASIEHVAKLQDQNEASQVMREIFSFPAFGQNRYQVCTWWALKTAIERKNREIVWLTIPDRHQPVPKTDDMFVDIHKQVWRAALGPSHDPVISDYLKLHLPKSVVEPGETSWIKARLEDAIVADPHRDQLEHLEIDQDSKSQRQQVASSPAWTWLSDQFPTTKDRLQWFLETYYCHITPVYWSTAKWIMRQEKMPLVDRNNVTRRYLGYWAQNRSDFCRVRQGKNQSIEMFLSGDYERIVQHELFWPKASDKELIKARNSLTQELIKSHDKAWTAERHESAELQRQING